MRRISAAGIGLVLFAASCQTGAQKNKTGVSSKPKISASVVLKESKLPSLKVNEAKALIGKRLFFDARLSGDGELSCASCHKPENGFSDGLRLSKAYIGSKGWRNTPTLINTAIKGKLGIPWFHDGRIGTNLNDITRDQITETIWMNMDMRLMQERIKQDPVYVDMFKSAGLGEPSNGKVRKLIPEYLNTLTSKNVPFDQGKMSASARKGLNVFVGKGNCVQCHNGPLFTDGKAHSTGVPKNPEIFKDPVRHMTFVAFSKFMGVENYMNIREDPGIYIINHYSDQRDFGKFMTPTLRELAQTAPYMHNGTIATLDGVIDFYNAGGGQHRNKSSVLKPLGLSAEEKGDLKAFLLALSGDPLTSDRYVYKKTIPQKYPPIKNWLTTKN